MASPGAKRAAFEGQLHLYFQSCLRANFTSSRSVCGISSGLFPMNPKCNTLNILQGSIVLYDESERQATYQRRSWLVIKLMSVHLQWVIDSMSGKEKDAVVKSKQLEALKRLGHSELKLDEYERRFSAPLPSFTFDVRVFRTIRQGCK